MSNDGMRNGLLDGASHETISRSTILGDAVMLSPTRRRNPSAPHDLHPPTDTNADADASAVFGRLAPAPDIRPPRHFEPHR
jgi:hypothetical protein